jgi:hypothetical protein
VPEEKNYIAYARPVVTAVDSRMPIRDRITAAASWPPARTLIKRSAHLAASARGNSLRLAGRVPPVANIFAASSPKSGSQWVKALLHHPIVRSHTGLFTLPQLDYQQRTAAPFPLGTFVPGLYLSFPDYQRIPKPAPHRTVYIFRDPRDIVVSGYYSQLKTHSVMQGLEARRKALSAMSVDEGLLFALDYGEQFLRDMATWVGVDDPDVRCFRLEDISGDPQRQVPELLAHCGVELTPAELDRLLSETSREALQQRDLAQRAAGSESHYRVSRDGYRELFKPEHYAAVDRVVPGLVEQLGYSA